MNFDKDNGNNEVVVFDNYSSDYKGVLLITTAVDAIKWGTENVVDPIIDTVQDTLSNMDVTYSNGINISGTPGIFCLNVQGGVSIDTKGNIALQGSCGTGVTIGTSGASITSYHSISNAPSINELEGLGCQIGGSGAILVEGIPLAIAGDFNIIPNPDKGEIYYGVTTNGGIGTSAPTAELHVEWGETATLEGTQFNIFDIWEKIYAKIMEW